jgi:hypothetical protein
VNLGYLPVPPRPVTIEMGKHMPGYYPYVLGDDGQIVNRVDIRCDDDAEAKRLAERIADVEGRAVELWQQARKIVRIKPKG